MRKFCFISAFIFFASCSSHAQDDFVSISLERTACYGFCPIYTVTLKSDGAVLFEGRQNVQSKGTFNGNVSPNDLARISKKLSEISFWTLEDSYRHKTNPNGTVTSVTDLPTKYIAVTTSTKSKRIEDYFGAPEGLAELEKLIDDIAEVKKWVGKPRS